MTKTVTCGDRISEALFDALVDSDDNALTELYGAIDEFRMKHPHAYHAVRKQPFARKLIDAIEEAHQYHLNMVA